MPKKNRGTDIRESEMPAELDRADDRLRSMSMGSEPSEEDIRMRAYQKYDERGGTHGYAVNDWIDAEQDLRESRS
jgi:hypothetical protein